MYIKWLLFLPVDIAMKIIGLIVAPIVSLFVSKSGLLPKWLCWFETPDSNMFGDPGDRGFREKHKDSTDSFLGRWYVCTLWQWRNTSQGFSTYVLGADDRGLIEHLEWIKDAGDLKKYKKTVWEDGQLVAFEYKGAFQWFGLKKRFRWRIGWKIHWDIRFKAQYVFSVSPFMSMDT